VLIRRSVLPTKMLLRVLLACLVFVNSKSSQHTCRFGTYLCRFANLLPDDLPLVGVVLLDCGKQRSTLLNRQHMFALSGQQILTSSSANSA
jgi:hypothetical protein